MPGPFFAEKRAGSFDLLEIRKAPFAFFRRSSNWNPRGDRSATACQEADVLIESKRPLWLRVAKVLFNPL